MISRSHRRTRLAVACLVLAACRIAGCAVQWQLDYDRGRQMAARSGRPMLLYFKDWSSSEHRNLMTNVFESPVVSKELNATVNIELLYNWGEQAAKYNIRSAQVCVFCRSDGAEVDRLSVNPMPAPTKFAEWLRACKAKLAPATQPGK